MCGCTILVFRHTLALLIAYHFIAANNWTRQIATPVGVPSQRGGHIATMFGTNMLVFGGTTNTGQAVLNGIYVLPLFVLHSWARV